MNLSSYTISLKNFFFIRWFLPGAVLMSAWFIDKMHFELFRNSVLDRIKLGPRSLRWDLVEWNLGLGGSIFNVCYVKVWVFHKRITSSFIGLLECLCIKFFLNVMDKPHQKLIVSVHWVTELDVGKNKSNNENFSQLLPWNYTCTAFWVNWGTILWAERVHFIVLSFIHFSSQYSLTIPSNYIIDFFFLDMFLKI